MLECASRIAKDGGGKSILSICGLPEYHWLWGLLGMDHYPYDGFPHGNPEV
jgi:hypothetical protein